LCIGRALVLRSGLSTSNGHGIVEGQRERARASFVFSWVNSIPSQSQIFLLIRNVCLFCVCTNDDGRKERRQGPRFPCRMRSTDCSANPVLTSPDSHLLKLCTIGRISMSPC
jgi:hypothetical protein